MTTVVEKKDIFIQFRNGLNREICLSHILNVVRDEFNFIESDSPEFVIFGPYGNDIPKGDVVKIGYFCENVRPDLDICDWAFGKPYESEINSPRYKRIEWHGFDPQTLIKTADDVEKSLSSKKYFCNFLYSNKVPYREEFFRKLSKYKQVDAPGLSMTNCSSIDTELKHLNRWERKRAFLESYKFTIAFENSTYPGYHTEKLLDPMVALSIPIYWGNPCIEEHFNSESIVDSKQYLRNLDGKALRRLESCSLQSFEDYRPAHFSSPKHRLRRKLRSIGRDLAVQLRFGSNFSALVDRIVELDENDDLYADVLSQPWYPDNVVPMSGMAAHWRKIFGK